MESAVDKVRLQVAAVEDDEDKLQGCRGKEARRLEG